MTENPRPRAQATPRPAPCHRGPSSRPAPLLGGLARRRVRHLSSRPPTRPPVTSSPYRRRSPTRRPRSASRRRTGGSPRSSRCSGTPRCGRACRCRRCRRACGRRPRRTRRWSPCRPPPHAATSPPTWPTPSPASLTRHANDTKGSTHVELLQFSRAIRPTEPSSASPHGDRAGRRERGRAARRPRAAGAAPAAPRRIRARGLRTGPGRRRRRPRTAVTSHAAHGRAPPCAPNSHRRDRLRRTRRGLGPVCTSGAARRPRSRATPGCTRGGCRTASRAGCGSSLVRDGGELARRRPADARPAARCPPWCRSAARSPTTGTSSSTTSTAEEASAALAEGLSAAARTALIDLREVRPGAAGERIYERLARPAPPGRPTPSAWSCPRRPMDELLKRLPSVQGPAGRAPSCASWPRSASSGVSYAPTRWTRPCGPAARSAPAPVAGPEGDVGAPAAPVLASIWPARSGRWCARGTPW